MVIFALLNICVMSNLEELYRAIETLRKNNIKIDDDLSRRLDEAEEKIIRDEIIPIIGNDIEPTLRQIKRKLVLVVDYDPEKPLNVRMTRKRVVTDIADTKEYPLLPLVQDSKPIHKQKIHVITHPRTHLSVTFPDGTMLTDRKAITTFLRVIERIGLEKIEKLGINIDRTNLIVRSPKSNGSHAEWHQVRDWYVNTHSSTMSKAKYLNKISNSLKLNLKIEIV
jgi:hypothetical protein